MPKFLVDESTGRKIFGLLSRNGYDVKAVSEILKGATDDKVVGFAAKEKRVIITDDKDFGELIFRKNMKSSGVMLLRTATTDADIRFGLLKRAISATHEPEKEFTVITEKIIRTRKIRLGKNNASSR
ncbi:MAG: DUF5615 family PIN-like protein [archaeon]